jgi:hypothetical protein
MKFKFSKNNVKMFNLALKFYFLSSIQTNEYIKRPLPMSALPPISATPQEDLNSIYIYIYIYIPYRPLLRRPKFNAGPINAGPINAGSKKLQNKEGLFFHFQKGDFVRK